MQDFRFNTTPSIYQQLGGVRVLGERIAELPTVSNDVVVMLVTDPGIVKLGLHQTALQSLQDCGLPTVVFDRVEADPKATTVEQAAAEARKAGVTVVIGFGGGSSMDVAKLVALLINAEQPLEDMYGVNQAYGTRLPLVLVPTTAGTGSEVTGISILTTGTEEKKGVVSPLLLPDLALLDAELTVGLPPAITAATGIDAMVHAIEAYTSKSASNNPISKMLAKQALTLLGTNIREAVFNGTNLEARTNMLLGSMLAGQAFANSPVAAVHALAYPIGSLFHVPHGLSNALVLCDVMRFNAPACDQQYSELAPYIFPDIDVSQSTQMICTDLINRLAMLIHELGLQTRLCEVGIREGDIDRLSEDAMKQTRLLLNNPRDITFGAAESIYRQAL